MIPLPRKLQPPSVAPSPGVDPELAPTESLFGHWSRYCFKYMPGPEEVFLAFEPYPAGRDLLAIPVQRKEQTVLAPLQKQELLIDDTHARAGQILGLTQSAVHAACGTDLTVQSSRRTALCLWLRACWPCMKLGFHSVLFQHYALGRCPLHGERLSTKCLKCGAEMRPTFMSVSRTPFACAKCGELWLRTVRPSYGDLDLSLVGAMLGDRRRDLRTVVQAGQEAVPVEQVDPSPLLISSNGLDTASYGRHVARSVVWPPAPSGRWPVFIERQQLLVDWSDNPAESWAEGGPLTRKAASDCLLMLARLAGLDGHATDSLRLRSRLSIQPRGLRLNDEASIVSVALHKTMCIYARCADARPKPEWPTHNRCSVYEDIEWNRVQTGRRLLNSDAGNAELVKAEILGWFAACIVDAASLSYLRNVEWLGELPKTLYLPVWVVSRTGNACSLRVRERVSDATVRRLLRRYSTERRLWRGSWASASAERRYFTPPPQSWRHAWRIDPPDEPESTVAVPVDAVGDA